jgi:hypothetical protein
MICEVILVIVHGQEQDLGIGAILLDLSCRLEAAETQLPMSMSTTSRRNSAALSTASAPLEASAMTFDP